MESYTGDESERALRMLARALAPYIAEELRRMHELDAASLSAEFDAATCERVVRALGDGVLERARVLFALLDEQQVIDSVQLARALGVGPRELSGNLTTPLKRRVRALGLPLPFNGGHGGETYGGIDAPSPDMDASRTHWQDHDGIAARMVAAIDAETARRASRAREPDCSADKRSRERERKSR